MVKWIACAFALCTTILKGGAPVKRKGWFVPIIVFFICMGFLFMYQQNQFAASHATPSDMPPILWSTTPDAINKITVKENGKKIEAIKKDFDWKLVSDTYTNANDFYILTILSNFKEPNLLSVVTSDNTALKEYGIDQFSKTIILCDKDNNAYELVCGKEATPTSYYVYSPFSGSVYTIAKEAFDKITSHPLDWRDLNYLYFDKNATTKITITYEGTEHTISATPAQDNKITFTSKTLSKESINAFILFLESTRIKDFITDNATQNVLSTYGFDNPVLKIAIHNKDMQVTNINIGSMVIEENLGYVTLNSGKAIFAIPYFNLTPETVETTTEKTNDENLGH